MYTDMSFVACKNVGTFRFARIYLNFLEGLLLHPRLFRDYLQLFRGYF